MPILSVGLSYKLNAVPNTDVGVLWCVGGPRPGTGPTCMDMHGSPLVYMASVFCALVALSYATSMTTATELDERRSGVPLGKEGESGTCVSLRSR